MWEVGILQRAELLWELTWRDMSLYERPDWPRDKNIYILIQFPEKEVEKMCVNMMKEQILVQVSLWLPCVGFMIVLEKIVHHIFDIVY